jgi:hypothetical protein
VGGSGSAGAQGCGPSTCPNGCCEGTTCVQNRTTQRCGVGGGACKPCGSCEACTNKGCDIDPASNWLITCGQAKIAMSPDTGVNWDPHSGAVGSTQPDPFCQFEMPAGSVTTSTAGVTDTIIDNFNPVWNQVVTPVGKTVKAADLMSTSKTWRLWVGDDDGCTMKDGCVGQEICEVSQPLSVDALKTGLLTRENLAGCLSLTVKFVCQP